MELDSAAKSWACLLSFRINLPKTTASNAIIGTVESIIKASFHEIKNKKATPPNMIMICLKNSAIVVRKVSCICEISEETRLVNSPTLFTSKKFIDIKIILSKAVLRKSRKVFSVTLLKMTTRKNENTA